MGGPSMGQITVQFMVAQIMVPIMGVTPLLEGFLQLAPITVLLVLITHQQGLTTHLLDLITHLPVLITHLQVTFLPNPAMPFHPHLVGWDDMD